MLQCVDVIGGGMIDSVAIEAAYIPVQCFSLCLLIIIIEVQHWDKKRKWGQG